jgi:hypothetical protein
MQLTARRLRQQLNASSFDVPVWLNTLLFACVNSISLKAPSLWSLLNRSNSSVMLINEYASYA